MSEAEQERARIVAYLDRARDEALSNMKRSTNDLSQRNWAATATAASVFRDAIERNQHGQ